MESSLVFFLVGLAIFGMKHLLKKQATILRLAAYVVVGIADGVIFNLLAVSPWPPSIRMPWGLVPFITGMTGLLLFAAEQWNLITKPGLQYIATILLGLILTGASYLFIVLYRSLINLISLTPQMNRSVLLNLLLICFLAIFGYTFPERWFKQEEKKQETRRETPS